ncbi:hypothetical protein, partial [Streptococcus pneumoniae]|uniref:hypothetical protein n=1 Tax=Streptococcus pneumoniae TaxID=1313 RepID=UPI0018B01F0B
QLQYKSGLLPDNETVLDEALSKAGLRSGTAVVIKKSIDARKEPTHVFSIDVFSQGEEVPKPSGFEAKNVSSAPEVHIVGL